MMRARILGNITLKQKISAVFILLVLLPAVTFGAFLAQSNVEHTRQNAISEMRRALQLMAQDITTRASQVEYLIGLLSTEAAVQKVLKYDGGAYGSYAVTMLYEFEPVMNQMTAYLYELGASVVLLTPNEKQPEKYEFLLRERRFLPNEEIQTLKDGAYQAWGGVGWHMPEGLMNAAYYAYESIPFYQKVVESPGVYLGIIKCSVDPKKLFGVLDTWEGEDGVLVMRNGTRVFGRGEAPETSFDANMDAFRAGDRTYVRAELPGMDMNLLAPIPRQSGSDVFAAVLPTAGLALLFAVVLYLLAHMVLSRILAGFKHVKRAIQFVDEGGPAPKLPESGKDEISLLFSAFNRLLAIREEQTERLARQERSMHAAQILALQCQMNPHFLFNALNWLQLSIETGRVCENTSDAIAYLSRVLHYNMSASHLSTVGDEIENLKQYLRFMDAREPGAIEAQIECPESLLPRPFLRFTLQPLVENAIRHGKLSAVTLRIRASFREEGDRIILRIANDGAVLPEAQMREINRHLESGTAPASGSLGLYNLSQRLHLLYGSVRIALSAENGRVVVEIRADNLAGEEKP